MSKGRCSKSLIISEMQNQNEVSPHTHQDGYSPKQNKNQKTMGVGEDVEILEPLCNVGRNLKWCSHKGKPRGGASKIKNGIIP